MRTIKSLFQKKHDDKVTEDPTAKLLSGTDAMLAQAYQNLSN